MAKSVLRSNSTLRRFLGNAGVEFLDYAVGAIERLLPHVVVSSWQQRELERPRAARTADHKEMTVVISFPEAGGGDGRSIWATVRRRKAAKKGVAAVARALDEHEHAICRAVVLRISDVLRRRPEGESDGRAESLRAISQSFDEHVVASYLRTRFHLDLDPGDVLSALHELAQQTYENKALSFGCVLDPHIEDAEGGAPFPHRFLRSRKKYRALTDGYRTAYWISKNGHILEFADLEALDGPGLSQHNYAPDWARHLARAARDGRCALCLNKSGDLLVFAAGTLRFTYRFGRWQYWNHRQIVDLVHHLARGKKADRQVLGVVVRAVYRAALDVSFRRSGALFVILRNKEKLTHVVRTADVVGGSNRPKLEGWFDEAIRSRRFSH